MFRERVGVVILEGGQPTDLVEHQMVSVRRGMTLDAIAKLRHIPEIDVIYLSTNYPELAAAATELGAVVVPEEPPFHFGRCLQYVINQGNLDGIIYMGGASCPFLTADEFRQIARDLRRYKNVVYTNNPQSADIVAFTPAKAINMIDLPDNDNVLPTRLRQGAGLERVFLPHSVGVHFDIDTPSDVLVMSLSPRVEQYTRQAIAALNWDNSRLRQAMNHLALPESNIFLAGRVNPWTMQHIGMYYRSRLRVISEERGMRATGRAERGEVHSLLAFMMEQLSPQGLIDYISSIADAAPSTRLFPSSWVATLWWPAACGLWSTPYASPTDRCNYRPPTTAMQLSPITPGSDRRCRNYGGTESLKVKWLGCKGVTNGGKLPCLFPPCCSRGIDYI